jgi:hypothetical protein
MITLTPETSLYQCLELRNLSLKLGDGGRLGSCHRDASTRLVLISHASLACGGDALDVFEQGAAADPEGRGTPGLPAFLPLLVRNQKVDGASLRPGIDADWIAVLCLFFFVFVNEMVTGSRIRTMETCQVDAPSRGRWVRPPVLPA